MDVINEDKSFLFYPETYYYYLTSKKLKLKEERKHVYRKPWFKETFHKIKPISA